MHGVGSRAASESGINSNEDAVARRAAEGVSAPPTAAVITTPTIANHAADENSVHRVTTAAVGICCSTYVTQEKQLSVYLRVSCQPKTPCPQRHMLFCRETASTERPSASRHQRSLRPACAACNRRRLRRARGTYATVRREYGRGRSECSIARVVRVLEGSAASYRHPARIDRTDRYRDRPAVRVRVPAGRYSALRALRENGRSSADVKRSTAARGILFYARHASYGTLPGGMNEECLRQASVWRRSVLQEDCFASAASYEVPRTSMSRLARLRGELRSSLLRSPRFAPLYSQDVIHLIVSTIQ